MTHDADAVVRFGQPFPPRFPPFQVRGGPDTHASAPPPWCVRCTPSTCFTYCGGFPAALQPPPARASFMTFYSLYDA